MPEAFNRDQQTASTIDFFLVGTLSCPGKRGWSTVPQGGSTASFNFGSTR